MKQVNDKFLTLTKKYNFMDFSINIISKLGKDGKTFLYHQIDDNCLREDYFNDKSIYFDLESLKSYLLNNTRGDVKGYLVAIRKSMVYICEIYSISEDNYDDYLILKSYENESFGHCHTPIILKTETLELKNGDYIDVYYRGLGLSNFFYDIDSVLNYLEYNDILHYSNKSNKLEQISELEQISDSGFEDFLARSSRSGLEKHQFKDFSGTFDDLDFCIKNNLTVEDFDEWQAVQRIIKHKIDWETAKAISNKLYEKDISVFDCE